jgi:alcohol dehydrogenase (NADP+)
VDKGVKPWIEVLPMKDVGKAVQNVKKNKVRYRYVLTAGLGLNGATRRTDEIA